MKLRAGVDSYRMPAFSSIVKIEVTIKGRATFRAVVIDRYAFDANRKTAEGRPGTPAYCRFLDDKIEFTPVPAEDGEVVITYFPLAKQA